MLNTIGNIRSNFVPDENTLSKDRDPNLINKKIKHLIQEKNRNRTKHKNPESLRTFSHIQGQVRLTTDELKHGTMADFQTN